MKLVPASMCAWMLFAAVCVNGAACKHDAPASRDAGAAAHANAASAPVDAASAPSAADAGVDDAAASGVVVSSVFDRILAKPNDANATPESLIPVVEQATGAKVAKARRTAVHWVLFQLAPANRTADDQAKAIDAIKSTGAFSAVEGDRVMKVQ